MYSKQKKSNISGNWEEIGVAKISDDSANVLNNATVHTGIKYVKKAKKTQIKK